MNRSSLAAAMLLLAAASRASNPPAFTPPVGFTVNTTKRQLKPDATCVRVVVTGDSMQPWRCAEPAPVVERRALWLHSPSEDSRLIVTMRIPGEEWALEAIIKTDARGKTAKSFIADVFRRKGACSARQPDTLSSYELLAKNCEVEKNILSGGNLDVNPSGLLAGGRVGMDFWSLMTPVPAWGQVIIAVDLDAAAVRTLGSTERPALKGDAMKAPLDALKGPDGGSKAP